jgi:dipeptidyl aminopeptidase/acylaminoacyl peptidase
MYCRRVNALHLAGGALVVVLLGPPALVLALAVRDEIASTHVEHHVVARPAGDAWASEARDVSLRTAKGVVIHGWFHPSSNGAAVVLATGADADRTQSLPEAHALGAAGYGVLVFDQPGNGESGGLKRQGDESDSLTAAVDHVAAQPGIRPDGIGAYGFSMGAAVLADVASSDTRLRAVALAACYTDDAEFIRHFRGRGPVRGLPGLWMARLHGQVFPHPLADMPQIAPRPVMLITGDEDPVVPWHSAEQLYAAASEPKELYVVHGAGHGEYTKQAGDEYGRRLVAFFDKALVRGDAR